MTPRRFASSPGLGVIGTSPASHLADRAGELAAPERAGIPGSARCSQSAVAEAESRGLAVSLVGWDGLVRGLFVFDEAVAARGSRCDPLADLGPGWTSPCSPAITPGRGRAIAQATRGDRRSRASAGAESRRDRGRPANARARSAWSATASTTRRPSRPATSASRWAAERTSRAIRRRSACSGDDLSRIPWSIELARRTRRVIRWNLVWAFGYNSSGRRLCGLGWLNPALAAFLMVASSTLVTVNSLRLGQPFEVDLQ